MEFVNNFFPFGVGGVGGHMVKQCLNFGTPLVFRLGKGMFHIISSQIWEVQGLLWLATPLKC